ncbi:unnamed protein product [Linum tenue]|uniref:Uncharacterized protein n=1 Tax=Linum tenue TaxID=586396 RepID=A0AAV0L5C0_9ROSI|nr:unnamed protein product [Linum tenue]
MVLFDFKSDKHFVASSNRATLQVYELTNPTVNPSSIRKSHWKEVATITAPAEEEEESYDGLMFFDGHGEIEGWEVLTKLAQHLTRLQLKVSPQGFCFQDVIGLGEHRAFGLHYLRLNDLFNWSYHGIRMASITMWPRRSVLKYLVPRWEKRPTPTGGVSNEKYEELKKTVEKKDEELEKLREEMEKLKENSGRQEKELLELEKKNSKELQKLLKIKDDELETLKREKDEEVKLRKGKDEELKKLREEVKKLSSARKEDEATTTRTTRNGKITVDIDEWDKLKKDEAEMRQEIMKKDEALQTLQLSHELEQRRKQLWTLQAAATTKLLVHLHLSSAKIIGRRRQVPRDTWIRSSDIQSGHFQCQPSFNGSSAQFHQANGLCLVDEDPKDWLPPPKIYVHTVTGSFDRDNWWFIKTTHPDGGLTMMAYYDGDFCRSKVYPNSYPIRLPYADTSFLVTDRPCAIFNTGREFKLAFMYRETNLLG